VINMHVGIPIFQQAMELYLQFAYPQGLPPAVEAKAAIIRNLPRTEEEGGAREMPLDLLEREAANSVASYALRLGQPMYPHMKLVMDPAPETLEAYCGRVDYIFRVDSHDRHLHAPPGSPDAAWLTAVRLSNKDLGEKIETAWAAAGLPTFKEFLRRQLEARKQRG
jgi:hypothetical protein